MELLNRFLTAIARGVNKNATKLEELQRLQFQTGRDSEGKQRKPYAQSTKRYKRRKGQQTSKVNLKDSGESYNSIEVTANQQGFEIDVDTEYFKYMVKKYGENTIGLEDKLLKQFFEEYVFQEIRNEFT